MFSDFFPDFDFSRFFDDTGTPKVKFLRVFFRKSPKSKFLVNQEDWKCLGDPSAEYFDGQARISRKNRKWAKKAFVGKNGDCGEVKE